MSMSFERHLQSDFDTSYIGIKSTIIGLHGSGVCVCLHMCVCMCVIAIFLLSNI